MADLVEGFEVQLFVKSVAVLDLHPSSGPQLQEKLLSLGGGQPVCSLNTTHHIIISYIICMVCYDRTIFENRAKQNHL